MRFSSINTGLTDEKIQSAISLVNQQGYAAIDLHSDVVNKLGKPLYQAIDAVTLHPQRDKYYNEIAFFWPEDWQGVEQGIGSFHEQKSLDKIYQADAAKTILGEKIGSSYSDVILDFAFQVKQLIIRHHHGLKKNELRLARVMVRQMNEKNLTRHNGSNLHEDIGYNNRPYQQLLSAIVTTFGIPTEAIRHQARVGELLIFNAYDRRRLLEMNENLAFVHKGPKSGPKMFFFFEFLGPRD
ncbi:MAG: hypothetical protein JNJ49_16410 [Bdellovibrionaceae bacterium]|nr:hypothetical protein [Pseudobdellovibrionaceae bacterium]